MCHNMCGIIGTNVNPSFPTALQLYQYNMPFSMSVPPNLFSQCWKTFACFPLYISKSTRHSDWPPVTVKLLTSKLWIPKSWMATWLTSFLWWITMFKCSISHVKNWHNISMSWWFLNLNMSYLPNQFLFGWPILAMDFEFNWSIAPQLYLKRFKTEKVPTFADA